MTTTFRQRIGWMIVVILASIALIVVAAAITAPSRAAASAPCKDWTGNYCGHFTVPASSKSVYVKSGDTRFTVLPGQRTPKTIDWDYAYVPAYDCLAFRPGPTYCAGGKIGPARWVPIPNGVITAIRY
jgi:hypothetical protein